MAYISDALGTIDGVNRGAIVSLDLRTGVSRRFVGDSTGFDPDFTFTINPPAGFVRQALNTASDGIALHPTNGRVYWSALQGVEVYSVNATFLRAEYTDAQTAAEVRLEGSKVDASDGTYDGDFFVVVSVAKACLFGCLPDPLSHSVASTSLWKGWRSTLAVTYTLVALITTLFTSGSLALLRRLVSAFFLLLSHHMMQTVFVCIGDDEMTVAGSRRRRVPSWHRVD